MPGTCVIGLQWGDEAKGKLVDILTENHEIVVRYQGGANAGHTVVAGNQTWKLSLIPSGILRDGVVCVVTGGVALDPASVIKEIDGLESRGVRIGQNFKSVIGHTLFFPGMLPKTDCSTSVFPEARPSVQLAAASAPATATRSADHWRSGSVIFTGPISAQSSTISLPLKNEC